MIHATGNIERVMDESRRVATTAILHCSQQLGISIDHAAAPIHLHFMGGSTPKDGPSAGGAIALALASVLSHRRIRRDVAMTGEIDTQGRITMVGGLDVKFETAYDAGCRTMIIPKQNLYGDGGVERLSEALKKELQVLTYEEWKENKSPFDYSRKLMELVAVDHIVQAADIAFINEDELHEIETAFVPHARLAAGALASAGISHESAACLLYLKGLQELEFEGLDGAFWENNHSVLVLKAEAKEAILRRFPVLNEQKRWREYDPVSSDVANILRELADSLPGGTAALITPSLVAPYYFLQRERKKLDEFCGNSPFIGLKLFANNFVAQGVKVRGCKAPLNRVMFHLSHLDPVQLRDCPFLKMHDGIYVLDMSFIPEKYRLDLTRAETILTSSLKNWLLIVEE
jgi:ATP-dependent Lon protease